MLQLHNVMIRIWGVNCELHPRLWSNTLNFPEMGWLARGAGGSARVKLSATHLPEPFV